MTAPLAKAILLRLKEIRGSGANAPTRVVPEENGAFVVQFNPTSLRISRQNNTDEGGSTTRTQRRQSPSAKPATLTFDLEFDTAEIEEEGEPVDVRTKTQIIRQFAEPTKEKPKDPPPPVKFIWGTFTFKGLVTQLNEELDYFAPDGTPLRAKVAVTITEQNDEFEAKLVGPGSRDEQGSAPPGGGAGPGATPATNPSTAALAQAGESVQQVLTRLNADPATWRAAMAGLSSPLALAAGAQVQLSAQASVGVGLGMTAGFAAGAGVSATAILAGALGISGGAAFSAGAGLSAGAGGGFSASVGAGFSAGAGLSAGASLQAAGFALAAGGGVAASFNVVAAARAEASVAQARAAFDVPGRVGGISASIAGAAVVVDQRTQSYGSGIPLRARADIRTVARTSVGGDLSVTSRAMSAEVELTTNAAIPPWQRLPASAPDRAIADGRQRSRDAGDVTLRWTPGR